jgi:protein HIRA/HIR1
VSLAPILDIASTVASEPVGSANISNAGITRSGYPIITLGNGDAYTYSREMYTWLRVSESWWAIISQYWDASGLRPPAGSTAQGTVGLMERRTDDEVLKMGRGRYLQRVLKATMMKDGFKGLETAASVGHLEVTSPCPFPLTQTRLSSSALLNSGQEYRSTMLMYVQRLAEEGLQDRLEQVFLDLLGPAYPLPPRTADGNRSTAYSRIWQWDSTVAGLDKRKLLREVLGVTGKFRELQALNVQYDTALKELEEQEVMVID